MTADAKQIMANMRAMLSEASPPDAERLKATAADAGLSARYVFAGIEVHGAPVNMAKLRAAVDLHNIAVGKRSEG